MSRGFTTKPGHRSLVQETLEEPGPPIAPGKRTLSEQLVIQRKEAGAAAQGDAHAAVAQLSGDGEPLAGHTRAHFEASLGADLSRVRVHTGSDSAAAAQQLDAHAFTVGRDIHFAAGRHRPEDSSGIHLLAHEVAHTVQQRGGPAMPQARSAVSRPGDVLEVEADRAADAMVQGSAATVSRGAAAGIQRQDASETSPAPTGDGGMCRADDPVGAASAIDPPAAGVNRSGYIDHDEGSNIRTRPAELPGSSTLTPAPLPPATRVFVSGRHPQSAEWLYVTAYLPDMIARGYVQHFRVTTDLPEPTARLHQIIAGDTAEGLARQQYASAVRDGHDLRYYENVLLYVNRERGRTGVRGEFQSPNIVGGGANNVQLVAGQRIWLVSAAYAQALESIVPSGSLTGGAVAGARRVFGHLEDIVASVTESPQYLADVAGEYLQAIHAHIAEIIGITAGFVAAELASTALAATPTGVGQLIALLIQLALAAFGAYGMVTAGVQALQHGETWLTTAWTCNGDPALRAEASRSFLRMLVSIAMAALAATGMRGNAGNALRIADNIHITPPSLTVSSPMVTPEGMVMGGGPRFTPGSITTDGPVALSPVFMTGPIQGGSAASLSVRANGLGHRAHTLREAAEALPDGTGHKWELIRRARELESQAAAVRELASESAEAADTLASEIEELEQAMATLEREIADAMPVTPPTSAVPRPHLRRPVNQLPVEGTHPYEPPTYPGAGEYVPSPQGGYIDRYGNRWEWAADAHGGPHWDVQHPNGSHTNVYPDGVVHQGADNF